MKRKTSARSRSRKAGSRKAQPRKGQRRKAGAGPARSRARQARSGNAAESTRRANRSPARRAPSKPKRRGAPATKNARSSARSSKAGRRSTRQRSGGKGSAPKQRAPARRRDREPGRQKFPSARDAQTETFARRDQPTTFDLGSSDNTTTLRRGTFASTEDWLADIAGNTPAEPTKRAKDNHDAAASAHKQGWKSREAVAKTHKRALFRHTQRKSRAQPLTKSAARSRGNAETRRRKESW